MKSVVFASAVCTVLFLMTGSVNIYAETNVHDHRTSSSTSSVPPPRYVPPRTTPPPRVHTTDHRQTPAANAHAMSEAQVNNRAEFKEWVIGANPNANGNLYPKKKWSGSKSYNYNLKGLVPRKFFHYEKQGSFGGINLGWTDNASARTGRKAAKWYFTRRSNARGPIKYGEPLAIAWGSTGYIYYAHRNSGINLDWSKKPHYQWKILGGKRGASVRRGKDKVIIFNTKHQQPLIYYKRTGAGHIGWPDSTDWSVRGAAKDVAQDAGKKAQQIATSPVAPYYYLKYRAFQNSRNNCKAKKDTCTNCRPPGRSNDDKDKDGIPDLLEYSLAHKFFPNVMVYGKKYGLHQAYLYDGYATPFTVKSIGGGQCGNDNAKKCLEIRIGITFIFDGGDDAMSGYGSHIGDGEMYMAVVKRNGFWAQAKNNVNNWQIIRDFTTAHLDNGGWDSSTMKSYPGGRSSRVKLHAAERKHALYHSRNACYEGARGFDDCPGKGHDLIQYKQGRLQNIGRRSDHGGMDTTIAHPVCGIYHVWGDRKFGEDVKISSYFEKVIDYKLGSNTPVSATVSAPPRPAQVSDHRENTRPAPRPAQASDHRNAP